MDGQQRSAALAGADRVEVVIEKLVEGGDGIARYSGVPLFVSRTVPGDRALVKLIERKPDYGRAEIEEILSPGAGRRAAPCSVFERCGGCDLQQLEDPLQPELKAAAALETLRRLGGVEQETFEVETASPWGYRTRMQLQIEGRGKDVRLGFFERRHRRLVAIDRCPVLHPDLETALPRIRTALESVAIPPKRLDVACSDGQLTCAPPLPGLPGGPIEAKIADFSYNYDARCFFQGHSGLVERLVECAVGDRGSDASTEAKGLALDLYCGVGLFTLPLATRHERVVGVESDRIAARYARQNSRRNGLRQVEIINQSVQGAVARRGFHGVDRVLVDPPRQGLEPAVCRALADTPVDRLTYVSCRPATLARDLRRLSDGYRLDQLVFFDLFPQTGHLEAVAQLRSRQSSPA